MPSNVKNNLFHASSTFGIGGAQVRFATLANRHKAQFSHLLFAMDGDYGSTSLLDEDIAFDIQKIDYQKGKIARNFLTFRRTLKDLDPSVLITYNWGSIEWALANFGRSLPHVHIVDGFGPEEADRQLPRRVYFRRLVFMRNTTVVVPSHTLYEIATKIWRIPPGQVSYIPNGIDCDRFGAERNNNLAEKYGIAPDDMVIGTVATLRPEKNIERLLLAFQKLPKDLNARLIIAGDGSQRVALETFASKLEEAADRIIFTGYIADPASILNLFDIFALSSDTEQMPISVLEAMAAGLPVAGVDVGDVRHIVSDANKELIVARDCVALSAAITRLAEDSALRDRLGEANRLHVRSAYDETAMVNAYERLFSGERLG